ncbi:MAG TPA: DUF2917 domain-containing protein, partial [Burkholderiaceae bacterium]|nr:DUF2917 domain-containing protein [Burkholderiaceae bacterium]
MDLPFDARSPAARAAAPDPGRRAASPRALVVVLHVGRVARLTRARGVRVAVDAGRLWVTVAGVRDDVFLGPGDAATFGHEGTLVVESDGNAPAVFRLERAAPARATPPPGRGAALARRATGVFAAIAAASRRLRAIHWLITSASWISARAAATEPRPAAFLTRLRTPPTYFMIPIPS